MLPLIVTVCIFNCAVSCKLNCCIMIILQFKPATAAVVITGQSTKTGVVMKIRHLLRTTKCRYSTEHLKMASNKFPQEKFYIKTKHIKVNIVKN